MRAGVEAIIALEDRRRIDQAILESYARMPPQAGEDDGAIESLRDAIAEEPW